MKRIIEERKRRGWSQSELARRAGMHNSTVSLIEHGRMTPYQSQLDKLAGALAWPGDPTALLEDADDVRA